MKITTTETYTLLTIEDETFEDFFQNFENEHTNLEKNHLIVNISDKNNISEKNISLFLKYADQHQNNGTSFVVIYRDMDVDAFPDIFNIVPTLVEAQDVIEMENIQRDLGF